MGSIGAAQRSGCGRAPKVLPLRRGCRPVEHVHALPAPAAASRSRRAPLLPGLTATLGLLLALGLLLRTWRAPTIAGTYEGSFDLLLYAGQALLRGELLHVDHVSGIPTVAQLLYAPAAWLGGLRAQRLLLLALQLLAAGLLIPCLRRWAAAGLLPLRRGSPVPQLAAILFLAFSQMLPQGLSAPIEQWASLCLVAALLALTPLAPLATTNATAPALTSRRRAALLLAAGAALGLAQACSGSLTTPLLLCGSLLLLLSRRRRADLLALLAGLLLAALVVTLPYLLRPASLPALWSGAVLLPLEVAARQPEGKELGAVLLKLLRSPVAGLPIWLLGLPPALGLAGLLRHSWRQAAGWADLPLRLPGLALVALLDLGWAFQRDGYDKADLQLMVLPLVLLLSSGLAALEQSERRPLRRLADLSVVLVPLIFVNNVLLAPLLHPPRPLNAHALTIEADRALVRAHLAAQPPQDRGFTAPQDVALHTQLRQPAGSRGIGSSWSLDQQGIGATAAGRRLGLPASPEEACQQLSGPAHRRVVWLRTDPEGPNTEAFLRGCLERSGQGWQDRSADLGLRSGEIRLFERSPQPMPSRAMSSTSAIERI